MRTCDVLLVNTNRIRPPIAPLALDYLGAALKAEGHEVRLLDLCWQEDAAVAVASALSPRPDLVAVTFRNTDDCTFASRASFVERLREDVALLRRQYDGPIILGGGGFSLMAVELLEHVGAEYGVRGDGEPALPAFLRALEGRLPFDEAPGLVWREGGRWRANAPWSDGFGLSGAAARDVVDNRAYFLKGGQAGLETKRGCSGRCVYCADPVIKGRRSRPRPAEHVVAEMRNLLAQGVDCLHLCDSEFNLPPEHAREVCEALSGARLGDTVRWYTYASPAPFSRELALLMKRAGCVGINFGADSGCDQMLAALGRDFTAAALEETAAHCRRAGLVFMYDLLLGGPGETPESLAETVALMKRISPDRVGASLGVRLYPGTPLATRLAAGGWREPGITGDPLGLAPAFYVSPALGPEPFSLLRDLIGKDERFLLPLGGDAQDYNYNDNTVLQRAIAAGHRGAYWDILRKLRQGIPPQVRGAG